MGESATVGMTETELGMSNCYHEIEEGLAEALKEKPGEVFAIYAGWNFNARVWFKDEKFHVEVWTYHVIREILSEDTLEEIMQTVSEKYGHD